MDMKETIRKILSEDFDWANDVRSDLPDESILETQIPVTLSLADYLRSQYGYDYLNIILDDDRIIDITIDGYDINYKVYKSWKDLTDTEGLGDYESYEEYISGMSLTPIKDTEMMDIIKKTFPFKLKGVFENSL